MERRHTLLKVLGALAAIASAVILVVVFWDKLLSLCPCRKHDSCQTDLEPAPAPTPDYNEEERSDFADLEPSAE